MGRKFSYVIKGDQLARGLRPTKRSPRNAGLLVTSQGAVGRNNILQVPDQLTLLDTQYDLYEDFPYPQLFYFPNVTIICGESDIYEWDFDAEEVVHKLSVTAGGKWSAVAYADYVYLSNAAVAVVRDPGSKLYAETTSLPTATAMCDYNGQVIISGPNVAPDAGGSGA